MTFPTQGKIPSTNLISGYCHNSDVPKEKWRENETHLRKLAELTVIERQVSNEMEQLQANQQFLQREIQGTYEKLPEESKELAKYILRTSDVKLDQPFCCITPNDLKG